MKTKIMISIATLIFICGSVKSSSPGTHMYVGKQTFEVWADYDIEFYNALQLPLDDTTGFLTQKFYLIGLTLPDLFDVENQDRVRTILSRLHEYQGMFWGPLDIGTPQLDLIAEDIVFTNGMAPPNSNPDQLRAMVEYAKNNNYSVVDKALVYGAYVHTIQDFLAHGVLQPALFGYGQSYDTTSSGQLLDYPEFYYELYTQTYTGDWQDWLYIVWPLFNGYDENNFYAGSFNLFMRCIQPDGEGCNNFISMLTPQDEYTISSLEKFIEAAIAVGYADTINGSNLTYDRLRMFLHGWGIALQMSYGRVVSQGGIVNGASGGVASHPNWSPSTILDYWFDMYLHWLQGEWQFAMSFFYSVFWLPEGIAGFAEAYGGLSEPWTSYYESSTTLTQNPELIPSSYSALIDHVTMWEQRNQVTQPSLRSTYSSEIDNILALTNIVRTIINTGSFSALNTWFALSRKSGITGGLFEIDETMDYFRQPGVFDLHFEGSDGLAFTETEVWPMIGFSDIDLKYDLVTFGTSSVGIHGNDPNMPLTQSDFFSADRFINTLTVNAHNAYQNGHTQLSFQIRTADKVDGLNYEKMLDSDYSTAYSSVPAEVKSGTFGYDSLFKNGNPVRNDGENPLENPLYFWPYVLTITNGLDLPQATVLFSAPEGVQLEIRDATYYDGSGYPNVFQPLGASYQVYLDTPEETYSIRAPLLINEGSGTYQVFDRWVAMDANGETLSATGIFEYDENRQTRVVFTDAIATIEAKYVEVVLITPGTPAVSFYESNGEVYLKAPKNWFEGNSFQKFSKSHTGDVTFSNVSYSCYSKYRVNPQSDCTITVTYPDIGIGDDVRVDCTMPAVPAGTVIEMPVGSSILLYSGNLLQGESGNPIILRSTSGNRWGGLYAYDDISYLIVESTDYGIKVNDSGQNRTVTGVTIRNSINTGLLVLIGDELVLRDVVIEQCGIGVEVDGAFQVLMDSCQVSDVGGTGVEIKDVKDLVTIERSLIADCGGTGLEIDLTNDVSVSVSIGNSTINDCDLGLSFISRLENSLDLRNSILAFNSVGYNIEYTGGGHHGFPVNRYYSDFYNIVDSTATSVLFENEDGIIFVDPLFDDDYHLTWANYPEEDETMSPCIDTGDTNTTDPDSTVADMGAFYYDYPPVVPENFSVSGNAGEHPILQWTHPHHDIEFFQIWRKLTETPSNYEPIATVPGNEYFWEDPGVIIAANPGKPPMLNPNACYKVHAVDLVGQPSGMTSPRCKPYVPQRLAQGQLPQKYALHRNHPNPFNPITTIRYDLPEASYVSLVIYDILGREIRTLLDNREEAGFKSVAWDGKDDAGNGASTGIYIYMLRAWSLESEKTYHKTEKMVLLR